MSAALKNKGLTSANWEAPTRPGKSRERKSAMRLGHNVAEKEVSEKAERVGSNTVVRKTVSKRTRFEIFKRDRFQCVHCGATPNDGPLHVDHLVALANGGPDDESNLVTACADCNLGKGAVPLERVKLRKGKATDADHEHAEQLREWLAIQQEVSETRDDVSAMLADAWSKRLGAGPENIGKRLQICLKDFSPERLFEAMDIVKRKRAGYHETTQLKYFYGILRAWREGTERPTVEAKPDAQGPMVWRQKQAMVALDKSCDQIRADPASFPTNKDRAKHIARAFLDAVGSPPEIEVSFARETEFLGGSEECALHARGLRLISRPHPQSKSIQWSVEIESRLDPAMHALHELRCLLSWGHYGDPVPSREQLQELAENLWDWVWAKDPAEEVDK